MIEIKKCKFIDAQTVRIEFFEEDIEQAVHVNALSGAIQMRFERDALRSKAANDLLRNRAMRFYGEYKQKLQTPKSSRQ